MGEACLVRLFSEEAGDLWNGFVYLQDCVSVAE
jgi:hypothetical protein